MPDRVLWEITMRFAVILISTALGLTGCTTVNQAGSVVGGYVGVPTRNSPPAGRAIIKALGGGLVGTTQAELSGPERGQALEAEYKALEYAQAGQAQMWGDVAGRHGEVRAATPYRVGSQDCRQYTHTLVLTGPPQVLRGTACRNSDGSWTLLT
jgi:surface antigen